MRIFALHKNHAYFKSFVFLKALQLYAVWVCLINPVLLESCTYVNSCKCVFSNGTSIDLTSLGNKGEARWQNVTPTQLNDTYKYYYNPCYDFNLGHEGDCAKGVSVCQVNKNATEFQDCGDQAGANFAYNETEKHVVLNYRSVIGGRSTRVTLVCSDDPDENTLIVRGETAKRSGIYEMTLRSHCACPNGCGVGMSFGTGLLIVFFVFVLVYISLGVVYNHLVRGAHGWELCPNYEFWRDFPLLVRDGCVYICSGCRRETTYERI